MLANVFIFWLSKVRNIPLLSSLYVKCFDQFCISCFEMLVKLSAEHSAIMKGKIMCWPMFLFSGYLMQVKQGVEHSALEYFVKCFDKFCISVFPKAYRAKCGTFRYYEGKDCVLANVFIFWLPYASQARCGIFRS